ncbi:MAG: ABC transporter ATP-binding protein [Bdellovibrionaceae bacterium]|nr:ABC transporter ATP-binding protein [Bdellovibrionales bacterium]MCB9254364.1 ABC transporter ATP-binding protein [Pseudobdellovibrionaceae bacterium]
MAETEEIIKVKNFYKKFGDKVVHKGVNLAIRKGEILTLMGGSGSGKSVLLRSMIGLEKPDKGQILFHGEDVVPLDEDNLVRVRNRIAYAFQHGALFDSLSVKENLAYPLRAHTELSEKEIHEKVMQTLSMVGLEGSEYLLPADLSGGMQKRVGVARSIIMDPEVILYDEPTTGLDPYNTRQILRIIRMLQDKGATSVLVTHDMTSLFAVSDRIAFLKDGKIIAMDTVDKIRKSSDPAVRGFIDGETD